MAEWDTDFYWKPGSTAANGTDYSKTPIGDNLAESAPEAAYLSYGQNMGVGSGEGDFDRWFRDQYSRAMTGYKQQLITDPMTTRLQPYLQGLGSYQDWYNRYQAQTTARQRGENYGTMAPQSRWISR